MMRHAFCPVQKVVQLHRVPVNKADGLRQAEPARHICRAELIVECASHVPNSVATETSRRRPVQLVKLRADSLNSGIRA